MLDSLPDLMSPMAHPTHYRLISIRSRWSILLVCAGVLALAFLLGQRASPLWLELLVTGMGGLVVLAYPSLIPAVLVAAALLSPITLNTGTDVKLNAVSLLIPVSTVIWLLNMLRRRNIRFADSRANRPLMLFLLANLLSLLIGRATWDPTVPVSNNFLLVQLAQWAIFAFSAAAFWLTANLVTSKSNLWRLTAFCLLLLGGAAIMSFMPGLGRLVSRVPAGSFGRVLLLALLTGLGGGQLLFNRELSPAWRIFLAVTLLAVIANAFIVQRELVAAWLAVIAAMGTLLFLRFQRLRWLTTLLVLAAVVTGLLIPSVYEFAGGEEEWQASGAPRLVLTKRTLNVTLRNPITGLGPAAYRPYAAMEPLKYGGGYWISPKVNSHNNYVDIFSQAGLLGLGLFLWFMVAVARMAWRLGQRFRDGFSAGYINGMVAVGVACMVNMLLADVFLPFVYNVGFPGFQASVLVWLFMGGLVALERMAPRSEITQRKDDVGTQ